MSHTKIIVDHEKIDYNGPVNVTDLLRFIENFIWEKGYDKRQDKDFEQNTANGKFLEWQISPWKKISDYVNYIIKIRLLAYNLVKTSIAMDGKKKSVDNGRILVIIDAFISLDYDSYWDDKPMLFFIRTIYDYFIFKAYTERFESVLVNDVNHLHHEIEKYLNMHRHYTVISKSKP